MRIKSYILLLMLFFITPVNVPRVRADSEKSQEVKIKAAFLYNFIKFVEWSEERKRKVNEPITIGIIGSKDFVKAFEPIKGKKIKNKRISIKYFAGYEKLERSNNADDSQWDQKIEALKVCHVLMFCNCNLVSIQNSKQIVKALEGLPILTVGETEHFLESGGTINFLMENEKVCFEINAAAIKTNKLRMSSMLLRLAKRVVKNKSP